MRVYVAEMEECHNSTSLAEGWENIVKVITPEDAKEAERIQREYGFITAKRFVDKCKQVPHKTVELAYSCSWMGYSRKVKIISKQPFVVVVESYNDMPDCFWHYLKFVSSKQEEINEKDAELVGLV